LMSKNEPYRLPRHSQPAPITSLSGVRSEMPTTHAGQQSKFSLKLTVISMLYSDFKESLISLQQVVILFLKEYKRNVSFELYNNQARHPIKKQ